jgi:hypothetical protein
MTVGFTLECLLLLVQNGASHHAGFESIPTNYCQRTAKTRQPCQIVPNDGKSKILCSGTRAVLLEEINNQPNCVGLAIPKASNDLHADQLITLLDKGRKPLVDRFSRCEVHLLPRSMYNVQSLCRVLLPFRCAIKKASNVSPKSTRKTEACSSVRLPNNGS